MPYYLTNYCHYSQLKLTLTSIAASGGWAILTRDKERTFV
jgi:hypothetical protein